MSEGRCWRGKCCASCSKLQPLGMTRGQQGRKWSREGTSGWGLLCREQFGSRELESGRPTSPVEVLGITTGGCMEAPAVTPFPPLQGQGHAPRGLCRAGVRGAEFSRQHVGVTAEAQPATSVGTLLCIGMVAETGLLSSGSSDLPARRELGLANLLPTQSPGASCLVLG